MATWEQISRHSFRAAKVLREHDLRSSVSRAYYAAHAALTWKLAQLGITSFPQARETPPHRNVSGLILQHFQPYYPKQRRALAAANGRLYKARLDADYKSHDAIRDRENRNALRDAAFILKSCGVPE